MKRGCLIPLIALLVILLCAGAVIVGYVLLAPTASKPAVLINAPRYGEQIEVGQETTIHSIARDERKVARVELWVDGQLLDAQASSLPGGISPFPLTARWQARAAGTHTITVRAFNQAGGRGHASINVNAIQSADRDRDGVPDAADACPDQPGSAAARGCPDRDADGIADSSDACPDTPGLPDGRGCPTPSAGDRDGDGTLDSADACPDQPGSPRAGGCPDADGDGIRDSADACPREPGPPERSGCPTPGDRDGDGVADATDACPDEPGSAALSGCLDSDGDGVRDRDDACPDVPGVPGLAGCPDRDGDGVRDLLDLCPDTPGPRENAGCPVTGAGDRDGDGVHDDTDLAPDEPGSADSGGAPPPGGGADRDGDGIADDEEAPSDPLDDLLGEVLPGERLSGVTFEALEFQLNEDYDEVYCYASLAGGPEERFGPFRPLGERRWDIAEYLGGANSRFVAVPTGTPLQVHAECGAYVIRRFPGGGEEILFDLGSINVSHPETDWRGHDIIQDSRGGTRGRSFRVKYRLCRGACASAALAPPILDPMTIGPRGEGPVGLWWSWDGDPSSIRGFKVYRNGNFIASVSRERRSAELAIRGPACGETLEFYVTAWDGIDARAPTRESPHSNSMYWPGRPCPRTFRVIFDSHTLYTHNLCCDGAGSPVGPIQGALWANDQHIFFDASDLSYFGTFNGLWLEDNHEYDIEEQILHTIARWVDSCLGRGCPDYWAPWDNTLTVSVDGSEDLTFGVWIHDTDKAWDGVLFGYIETGGETACEAQATIPARDLRPGTYRANGERCDMTVVIEEVRGP